MGAELDKHVDPVLMLADRRKHALQRLTETYRTSQVVNPVVRLQIGTVNRMAIQRRVKLHVSSSWRLKVGDGSTVILGDQVHVVGMVSDIDDQTPVEQLPLLANPLQFGQGRFIAGNS